jgi:hypothetical protein
MDYKLKKLSETAMVTGKVRFSFANVFEPKSVNGGDPKYSVSLLISKDETETIEAIKECIEEAKKAGISKFGGKIPANLKIPLRDGDEEKPDDENYQNCYFVNAASSKAPGVFKVSGGKLVKIGEEEFYSGCYGRASINFYAFNVNSKGIACGLNDVLKVEDGDKLSGGSNAAEAFGMEVDGEEFM